MSIKNSKSKIKNLNLNLNLNLNMNLLLLFLLLFLSVSHAQIVEEFQEHREAINTRADSIIAAAQAKISIADSASYFYKRAYIDALVNGKLSIADSATYFYKREYLDAKHTEITEQARSDIDDSLNNYTKIYFTEGTTQYGIAVFYTASGQYVTSVPILINPSAIEGKWIMDFQQNALEDVSSIELNGEDLKTKIESGDAIGQAQIQTLNTNVAVIYDSLQAIVDYINSFLPIINDLDAPTLTSVTADGDSSIIKLVFVFDASSDSGVIQRGLDYDEFTNIDTVNENVTSYTDTTTIGNTMYYYRLYSYNSSNTSNYSSVLDATTIDTSSTPTVIADYFVTPWGGGDTLSTIAEVNLLAGSAKKVVFLGSYVYDDDVLVCKEGWTYQSFGSGLAIIGDSSVNLASNPYNATIYVGNNSVTLDSLIIYGYKDEYNGITFDADGLTIKYCEIIGGSNSHEDATRGIHQIGSSTDGLTITHNTIKHWGEAGIKWSRPINSEVSYNDISWIWLKDSHYDHGGSGIMNVVANSATNSVAFHDCNYTVNIHHNEIHHFDYVALATLSRMIIEYNNIHSLLDERIYHNAIKYRAAGKLYDIWGTTGESKAGVIFRYNYVHDLGYNGLNNYTYDYPTDAERTAGTPDVVTTSNGFGYPRYLDKYGEYEAITNYYVFAGSPEPVITGSGYANSWVHNNLFYRLGGAVLSFGQNSSSDGGITWSDTKISYFINNTVLKCGSNAFATYATGLINSAVYKPSPSYFANNLLHDNSSHGASITVSTNGASYVGYNLFFNSRTGMYINTEYTAPARNTHYAIAVWGRSESGGAFEGTATGNQYSVDSSEVWNNMADSVFCDSIGIAGVWIPDVRLVVSGEANNSGKAFNTLGDENTVTYLEWSETHSLGQDGSGRSFAYDIFGKLRTDNDIGAVGDTALNP